MGSAKKAHEEGRTIVWVDEAAFALLPLVMRTYAPCGQTPTPPVSLTYDHLAVIGTLTADGKMVMPIQETPYRGPDIVHFLQVLLRKLLGKLLVIWDRASIHRNSAVKDFLFFGRARCLHLECLPAYVLEQESPRRGVEFAQTTGTQKRLCA